jgi:hypothetical protein
MTPSALIKAALRHQSVTGFHMCDERPMPAAFVASMQFRAVMLVLPRLKPYKPRKDQYTPAPWKRKTTNS